MNTHFIRFSKATLVKLKTYQKTMKNLAVYTVKIRNFDNECVDK